MTPTQRRPPPNDPGSILGFNFPLKIWREIAGRELYLARDQPLVLSTQGDGIQEIILDYGRSVGGMPFIETVDVTSNGQQAVMDVVYSETSVGVHNRRKGKGCTNRLLNEVLTLVRRRPIFWIV